MAYRAKTKLACEIAGIEPTKVADAIQDGHITFAPHTTPGKARVFEVHDIVALSIYAFLTEHMRMSLQVAGRISEDLKRRVCEDTQDRIGFYTVLFQQSGLPVVRSGIEDFSNPQSVPKRYSIVIDAATIRRDVKNALEIEASILGDD